MNCSLYHFFNKVFLFCLVLGLPFANSQAGSVRIALSSGPSNLNPFFSTDANSQNIARLTHLSLVDLGPEMNFFCRLCKNFSERIDSGKHIISFELKKGIKFWDGSEVTAQDVKKSAEYFTTDNENIKSIFRFAFRKIIKVVVHDRYKVDLVYKHFDLENMSNLPLFKILKINDLTKGKIENNDIIGAGEYKYSKVTPFEVKLVPSFDKSLSDLIFKVVKDDTTLILKLINNEIDLSVSKLSLRKVIWLQDNKKDIKINEAPSTIYKYVGLNMKKKVMQNQKLRQALSLLIPRKKILKHKFKGHAQLSHGMLSSAFGDVFYAKKIDSFNPKQAEQLLDEAGYSTNKNGVRLELNWLVSNSRPSVEIVKVIAESFKRSGVVVNIVTQEWGTYLRSTKKGQFELYSGTWVGFTGPDMFHYAFHSEKIPPKGGNRVFYKNTELDEILVKAGKESHVPTRIKKYHHAQRIIGQDYPYIDLWHPNVIWPSRSCVNNVKIWPNASFLPLLELKSSCHE